MKRFPYFAALVLIGLSATAVHAQKVVAVGDEWVLSNDAFATNPTGTTNFALNIASQFAQGQPAVKFLAYSSNFGLTGTSLAAAMTGAGYDWTVSTAQPFTLATLNNYRGVFLGGAPGSGSANAAILAAYVNGGGNVYLMGGTGELGSAGGEAIAWDPFLSTFGLGFGSTYFEQQALVQITPVPGTNPLLSGVPQITWGFGQSAFETNPANPLTDTITGQFSINRAIMSTYNVGVVAVPEPSTVVLVLPVFGLLGTVVLRRRNR